MESKLTTNIDLIDDLTLNDIKRYKRQMILKEISLEGQISLKKSKVLVIGAGGIGSPLVMYLAGSGIGTIGIMDGDVIEESNLHRQIIHDTVNVGMNKVESRN